MTRAEKLGVMSGHDDSQKLPQGGDVVLCCEMQYLNIVKHYVFYSKLVHGTRCTWSGNGNTAAQGIFALPSYNFAFCLYVSELCPDNEESTE